LISRLPHLIELQVKDYPFPDHYAPPLKVLFQLMMALDSYLNDDMDNVAVVHCLGGKGRTGTIIVCYLFFSGKFATIEEAATHFAQKRSKIGKGVTQPSQQRYHFFHPKVHAILC
jgi:phosphatidylinositol-3,4,5-trisphosphate 3-phosphatase/dual-specificity protein phosphatase PTEN